MAGGHGIVRELRDELMDRLFGIEADLERIRADERAAEDAAGQARDGISLERLEGADRNLRGVGDLPQRDAAALARLTQPIAEIARCSIRSHSCAITRLSMLGSRFDPVKPPADGLDEWS